MTQSNPWMLCDQQAQRPPAVTSIFRNFTFTEVCTTFLLFQTVCVTAVTAVRSSSSRALEHLDAWWGENQWTGYIMYRADWGGHLWAFQTEHLKPIISRLYWVHILSERSLRMTFRLQQHHDGFSSVFRWHHQQACVCVCGAVCLKQL